MSNFPIACAKHFRYLNICRKALIYWSLGGFVVSYCWNWYFWVVWIGGKYIGLVELVDVQSHLVMLKSPRGDRTTYDWKQRHSQIVCTRSGGPCQLTPPPFWGEKVFDLGPRPINGAPWTRAPCPLLVCTPKRFIWVWMRVFNINWELFVFFRIFTREEMEGGIVFFGRHLIVMPVKFMRSA